jgi:hypothetical protein
MDQRFSRHTSILIATTGAMTGAIIAAMKL